MKQRVHISVRSTFLYKIYKVIESDCRYGNSIILQIIEIAQFMITHTAISDSSKCMIRTKR